MAPDAIQPLDAARPSAERLDVAENATTAYVRVHGRATFKSAPVLRDFILHELAQARLGILIDFSECEGVDSTFVGTLTSLSLQCRRSGRGCIKLFNVPPHVYNVFHTLGLTMVLDLAGTPMSGTPDYQPAPIGTYSRTDIASLMLDAHQTLAALNDKNALEFRNVIEFLRASLPPK